MTTFAIGTQRFGLGWSGCSSLETHRFRGQLRAQALLGNSAWVVGATVSVVPAYAQTPLCVSVCMWLNVLGGVTHSIKWIPVDRRVQDRSLWMEREKRRDDDEGW